MSHDPATAPDHQFAPVHLYGLEDIARTAATANHFLTHARKFLFAPDAQKKPPIYSMAQLANFIGVDKATVSRRVANPKDSLPKGQTADFGKRNFGVEEIREWARAYGMCHDRKDEKGFVICVGNFKGGVSKTTTVINLAQGLSLRGYRKVLLIDFDSQASLTNLLGIKAEYEVEEDDTFLPLAQGKTNSIKTKIRNTYWPGIDIVPASVALGSAEFYLSIRQANDKNFSFFNVLQDALNSDEIKDEYDYIIIDTPPSMSYLTVNAFWSADGLLVPLPPEGTDFTSSTQFWSLFAQMAEAFKNHEGNKEKEKTYHWIKVLPTKVDRTKPHTQNMMEWISTVYGSMMMTMEIPATSVVSVAGTQLGSIYDISKYVGSAQAYKKARDAYDKLVTQIDAVTRATAWK